jgi:hypothetical protein
MKLLAFSLTLLSVGCLSRTLLGSERVDAGCDGCDGGAETDAAPPEDPRATFIHDLTDGRWRGLAEVPGLPPPVRIELEFHGDGHYVARCLEDPDPACMPFPLGAVESGRPGRYWITDLTSNGEFWGRTVDSFRGQNDLEGELDHMTIQDDELHFVRKQRLDVVELTAAVLVLERVR